MKIESSIMLNLIFVIFFGWTGRFDNIIYIQNSGNLF